MEENQNTIPEYGRKESFDERSRNYPVRAMLPKNKPLRSYTWRCYNSLDQGYEGSCVGFAWGHELAARPSEVTNVTTNVARGIYKKAQFLDEWPGENYEGTSILAGVKAVRENHPGKIQEYRWGFSLDDVLMTLGYLGPVVLGLPWFRGMEYPTSEGIITPTSGMVGAHAILANGISVKKRLVRLHNSWGEWWGIKGDAFIKFDDLGKLLHMGGESCIATIRGPEKRLKFNQNVLG